MPRASRPALAREPVGKGLEGFAQGAGVNQGLIPYYFGTNEALWHEAVDRAFAHLREGLDDIGQAAAGLSGRERLALMIRRYFDFVARHPEFVRLMNEEGKRDGPRMRWLTDTHVRPLPDGMLRVFDEAHVMERLPAGFDPIHLHYIIVGAVATIFHQAHECRRLTGYDPTTPEAAHAHADVLIALLLGDGSLARDIDPAG